MHEKLKNAANMCGGVSDLCKLIKQYKFLEPAEIVSMAEIDEWVLDDLKQTLKGCKKVEKAKPKVSEYEMELFTHSNVTDAFKIHTDQWNKCPLEEPLPITIRILLEARKPEELTMGLDNPRILQKIKDGGDFQQVWMDLGNLFKDTVNKNAASDSMTLAEKQAVIADLKAGFHNICEQARERAQAVAHAEFGKKSSIASEGRSRVFKCVVSVSQSAMSIIGTIGAFITAIPVGLVAVHGCAKSVIDCIIDLQAAMGGFESNMRAAEAEYGSISRFYNEHHESMKTGAFRIAETAFGSLANPAVNAEKHLTMASNDLNKLDDKVNDLVGHLNEFIGAVKEVSVNMISMNIALSTPDEKLQSNAALVDQLKQGLVEAKESLSRYESMINNVLVTTVEQAAFIKSCQERIDRFDGLAKSIEAAKRDISKFLIFMDALEVTSAIVGGAYAGGSGFVSGINPVNDLGYVTAFNIVGQVEAGADVLRKTVATRTSALEESLAF